MSSENTLNKKKYKTETDKGVEETSGSRKNEDVESHQPIDPYADFKFDYRLRFVLRHGEQSQTPRHATTEGETTLENNLSTTESMTESKQTEESHKDNVKQAENSKPTPSVSTNNSAGSLRLTPKTTFRARNSRLINTAKSFHYKPPPRPPATGGIVTDSDNSDSDGKGENQDCIPTGPVHRCAK